MNEIKGGYTLDELTMLKEDTTCSRTCRTCLKNKSLKSFSAKQASNELYYIEYECNSCKYSRKKRVHKDMIDTYLKRQKEKENFTIEGRAMMLRNRCKMRAKKYNMEFTLSKDCVVSLLSTLKCAKTGIDLIMDDSVYNPYAPSIDRIDSNKGYTDDNIQFTCMIYNFCKNSFTEEQVEEFFNKLKV